MGEYHRIGDPQKGYPSTEWFNLPITKDVALAGVPGVHEAAAMAEYGRVNIPQNGWLDAIHLHQDVDGNSGTTALELYRNRQGAFTLIASASLANGGGDFGFLAFAFVSTALMYVLRGDYLMLQATSKMGGTPVGFVDVHFQRTAL